MSEQQSEHSLELRLMAVERRCATTRNVCIGLLVAGAALVGMAQTSSSPPKVVSAQQFLLINSQGKTLGQWVALPDGSSALKLQNTKGAPGIVITAGGDGTGAVQIKNPNGGAIMLAAIGGGTLISFADNGGRSVYRMGVDDTGRFASGK